MTRREGEGSSVRDEMRAQAGCRYEADLVVHERER